MQLFATAPNVDDLAGQHFLLWAGFPEINCKSSREETILNIFARPKLQIWRSATHVVPACSLKNH
jgi:hypothetical protein